MDDLLREYERACALACPCCTDEPTWGEFLCNVVEDHERFEPALRQQAYSTLLDLVRDVRLPATV